MRVICALAALLCAACGGVVKSNVSLDTEKLAAMTAVDYAGWTAVLKTYVDDKGEVDYPRLKADRGGLDAFVAQIAAVGPKTRPALFKTREDQLAYYINAYNALTMFNVINRYPEIQSVIDSKLSFFVTTKFLLDGEETSLYALENDLIRPTFNEPRVHFALNCASAGCPVLPAEPFLPATLEAQLARETGKFVHESRNVAVEGGKIVLSEIFNWYAEDFPPSPVAWIRTVAPDLTLPEGAEVTHRPYGWALNDQTRP